MEQHTSQPEARKEYVKPTLGVVRLVIEEVLFGTGCKDSGTVENTVLGCGSGTQCQQ